jgi:hypothetical protein
MSAAPSVAPGAAAALAGGVAAGGAAVAVGGAAAAAVVGGAAAAVPGVAPAPPLAVLPAEGAAALEGFVNCVAAPLRIATDLIGGTGVPDAGESLNIRLTGFVSDSIARSLQAPPPVAKQRRKISFTSTTLACLGCNSTGSTRSPPKAAATPPTST